MKPVRSELAGAVARAVVEFGRDIESLVGEDVPFGENIREREAGVVVSLSTHRGVV